MFELWIWSTWLTKITLYLSTAFMIGGAFCYFLLWRYTSIKVTLLKYMHLGATLGLVGSTLGFFILVGSFANTGLSGIFDQTYLNILLNTNTGQIHIVRIISFALIFLLLTIKLGKKTTHIATFEKILFAVLLIPILYSYSQIGHVTNLPFFAQILLSIHVFFMSLWMGSLYPLWKMSHKISGRSLRKLMEAFGRIAAYVVGILILCGITIALFLFKDLNTLIYTSYGHGFVLKLAFVGSILLLAAFNKWFLTPRLEEPLFAQYLSCAILFEMYLGLLILLTTSYITTVVGID
ncbi:copper resistance D family protein [Acinetobacter guillouiae]|uniref:copper resistance D family protein n=1 Tax=Acinetobacter TaxID=469 RepID=UPI00141B2EF4|nr:putative copper resistance protein D [Acinetobacter guillouiae]MCW2249935.1 putative copper resistance protein D [Acinetobacter sp. BIGb0204]NII39039.1 putative copper resistance protein D [Acinetobacter sp. BIGb0196]